MKNLIAFDIGTAKVVAVLGVVSKNGVLEKKSEVVLGSFPIIKDKKINIKKLKSIVLEIMNKLDPFINGKTEVVFSIPAGLILFDGYNLSKKEQKNIDKFVLKNKQAGKYYFVPMISSHDSKNNGLYKFPYAAQDNVDNIEQMFLGYKTDKAAAYYPLSLYRRFSSDSNYTIINLGGSNIELISFQGEYLREREVLPVGGENIIKDLCYGLSISYNDAAAILFNYVDLFSSFLNKQSEVTQKEKIIDARIKEIFLLIKRYPFLKTQQIILTGGLAALPKLSTQLEAHLNIPITNINEIITNKNPITLQAELMLEEYYKTHSKKRSLKDIFAFV